MNNDLQIWSLWYNKGRGMKGKPADKRMMNSTEIAACLQYIVLRHNNAQGLPYCTCACSNKHRDNKINNAIQGLISSYAQLPFYARMFAEAGFAGVSAGNKEDLLAHWSSVAIPQRSYNAFRPF